MNNVITMYHYIRDNTKFKAFSVEEFRTQIEYLKEQYKIISIKELIANKPNENTCVLTFDDGLKDGITNALPILQESRVKATFFIPTATLVEKKILKTQKIQLLLAKLGTKKVVREFNGIAEDIFQIRGGVEKNILDDKLTSTLKYVLNFMDTNKSTIYLDKIFNKYFQEEEEFDKLYLSKRDIHKLKESGMEIGLHGHNHLYLGKLYYQDALKDLTTSVEVFKKNFPNENLIISYPFGSYNFFTKRIAKQLGIVAGVTITEKVNSDLENLLELNRYDCIKIPPRGSDL